MHEAMQAEQEEAGQRHVMLPAKLPARQAEEAEEEACCRLPGCDGGVLLLSLSQGAPLAPGASPLPRGRQTHLSGTNCWLINCARGHIRHLQPRGGGGVGGGSGEAQAAGAQVVGPGSNWLQQTTLARSPARVGLYLPAAAGHPASRGASRGAPAAARDSCWAPAPAPAPPLRSGQAHPTHELRWAGG